MRRHPVPTTSMAVYPALLTLSILARIRGDRAGDFVHGSRAHAAAP